MENRPDLCNCPRKLIGIPQNVQNGGPVEDLIPFCESNSMAGSCRSDSPIHFCESNSPVLADLIRRFTFANPIRR